MEKAHVLRGIRWSAAVSVLNTLASFAQVAFLSWYLDPEHFGVFATLLAVIVLLSTVATSAFPDYIIVTKDDHGTIRSTLYWLSLLIATFLYIALFFLAPQLSYFLLDGDRADLIRVAGLGIVLAGLTENFRASLRKALRFRAVAITDLAGAYLGLACALGLSGTLRDERVLVYALLFNQLTAAVLLLAFAAKFALLPRLTFCATELKAFFRPGLWRFSSYLLNTMNARFDILLITWLIGSAAAGSYFVAWRIAVQPLARIMPVLIHTALPIFGRISGDVSTMQIAYQKVMKLLALVLAPLVFAIFAFIPFVAELVLGPSWGEVPILVQVLSIGILVRLLTAMTNVIMLARRDFSWSFRWQALMLVTSTVTCVVASYISPSAFSIALGLTISQSAIFILMYAIFLQKFEVTSVRSNVSGVAMPMFAAFTSYLMIKALLEEFVQFHDRFSGFVIMFLACAAVYAVVSILLMKEHVKILRTVVRH